MKIIIFLLTFILIALAGYSQTSKEEIKSDSIKIERKPSSFIGDVQVNIHETNGVESYKLVQIIDNSNKVICYGKVGKDSSSMSCVPLK